MKRPLINVCTAALSLLFLNSCSNGGLFGSGIPATLEEAWATDNTLKTPESVLHDEQRNVLYVTNINQTSSAANKDGDGFVSILSLDGDIEQLYWVTGLNDPKGMALFNNVLYVADLDEIVAIATQSGSILGRYKADGAKFLNDVTVATDGTVFVSDSDMNRIYQLRNGRVSTFIQDTKEDNRPNGLLFESNRLIIAFSGSGVARFYDPNRKQVSDWTEGIPSADGVVRASTNGYFISNWNGEVYYVNKDGRNWKVLDTKDSKVNAADIEINTRDRLLYVPTFFDNRVVAYRISGAGL
ncbi:gluconolaconase [Pontibacter sp. SGAir0037]|uniref:gluconolaconase n=1 Tax=Pontibacter sp. SGAir0037 TaxID=2571030 RepID=UPI0010CD4698|nr:gluconolaconase [Pontibacter sp. SGAir0037]QCR21493.1 gluconolaconase [Pontibacter sp. SGAir0037]